MKLASIWFDDIISVPGGKDGGSGTPRQTLMEQSFHASDGWEIERVGPLMYRLFREPMLRPATIEGYPASWLAADDNIAITEVDPTGLVVQMQTAQNYEESQRISKRRRT